jgi:superfamily II DNA/RNA helicase
LKPITFTDLGLDPNILKAIADVGYEHPTEIQGKAIPSILMMKDVIGIAQTGTGKTGAFTLPMIEVLQGGVPKGRMPRGLVLTPTRELAAQVADNIELYAKYLNLSHALIVGGVQMADQVKKLERGVDILIATPGRLMDLQERGNVLLRDIKFLVIDEADRMLDMGFIPDIEKIIGHLPPLRQNLLFSATMPKPIQKLAEKLMDNPKTIEVAQRSSTAKNVTQKLIMVPAKQKTQKLVHYIKDLNVDTAFIFCNRKRDIDGYARALEKAGVNAGALHGDMSQNVRTETLGKFKDGKIKILVCSDVAARGIDISDVGHVFNMDLPMNAEDYVHRIGRTGRAGKSGEAYSFVSLPADEKYLDAIETLIETKIDRMDGQKETKPEVKAKVEQKPKAEPKPQNQNKNNSNQNPKPFKQKNHHPDDEADIPSPVGFGDELPGFMANGK